MTILVVAEHDNTSLKGGVFNTVTAAAACGGDIHILVSGHDAHSAAQAAGRIEGVSLVLHADAAHFANGLAEELAAQVAALANDYSHVLFPATASGKNTAPRVAALLNVAQISDVSRVLGADTFERPIYAGNAIATVQSGDAIKVITVRATAFDAAARTDSVAEIRPIRPVEPVSKSRFVSAELSKSERPDLRGASVVVSGGRGLGSEVQFNSLLAPLADKLHAALGASRAAVDSGYAPNDLQVGQTGKIVAPQLYIACGISGAIQHLAGMKDSKVIVAINKDPEAPIFGVADYGLVDDIFSAVPELTDQL